MSLLVEKVEFLSNYFIDSFANTLQKEKEHQISKMIYCFTAFHWSGRSNLGD